MWSCKKILLLLLLATALPGIPSTSVADAENDWLVGVWVLTDSSKEEFLQFTENDEVSLISGKGREIKGDYTLGDSVIKIVYNFRGKRIPIDLTYTSAKDVLTGNLSNTGRTVHYTKKR